MIYLDNCSTIIDTNQLLDDSYKYQNDEVRAKYDRIYTEEMVSHYGKTEDGSTAIDTDQRPGDPSDYQSDKATAESDDQQHNKIVKDTEEEALC